MPLVSGSAWIVENKSSLITYQMQMDDLTLCNSRSLDESSGTHEIYHDLRVLTKVRPAGDAPDHGATALQTVCATWSRYMKAWFRDMKAWFRDMKDWLLGDAENCC